MDFATTVCVTPFVPSSVLLLFTLFRSFVLVELLTLDDFGLSSLLLLLLLLLLLVLLLLLLLPLSAVVEFVVEEVVVSSDSFFSVEDLSLFSTVPDMVEARSRMNHTGNKQKNKQLRLRLD